MGISGLLPLLKSIHKPCNLKKFAGQTIGVDAYGWLHRGAVACAIDLAFGKPTTKFVEFSMNRVRMLIHFGVTPFLVFDGDYLPSKAATERERAKKREESKRLGLELHRLGKKSQAHLELQKAVDVTPEMARQLIEELKILGLQYIVAPYEADSQLAYLEKKGAIQGILSEDSDLLVFGAKRLLTKLDQYGDCIEISRSDFTACREISLVGWTDDDFRRMAILSGCDYLTHINKIGLKTAYRFVRKYKTIEKILRMLQFDGQYYVPVGYLEAFKRAELTFLHQRVFCPEVNSVIMMTTPDPRSGDNDLGFLGSEVEHEVALGVVRGDLHPMTKQPIVVKGNLSQSSRTPGENSRRQTLGTPLDLKSNRSIDMFFNALRTPLAELDPNSFTPSPSQQRILQQNNGTWASESAPPRPRLARSSASIPTSDSVSSMIRATSTAVVGSVSAPHPPKKRRLCPDLTETEKASQTPDTTIERSRFFAPCISDPSPLMKRNKRHRDPKASDFDIWSDDSIDNVMAELPDTSQRQISSRRGSIKVFKDHSDTLEDKPPTPDISAEDTQPVSQCSTASRSTVQSEISVCTCVTSVADSVESKRVAKTLDSHVQSDLATLKKDFLYLPEPERCRVQRQEITKSSARSSEKPALNRKGSMTPLQRLGATALNRSQSCSSSLNRMATPRKVPQGLDASNQLPKLTDDLASSISVVAPTPDVTVARGSEDAMIPDSEGESEDSRSEHEQEKRVLDLGRFAFTG
ncbi:MAG: hypothetical protein Q9186_000094 [Xanthomendoza sp. 1 TL-2023]